MFLVLAFATVVPFSYDGALRAGQTLTVRDLNGGIRVRAGDRLAIRATKRAERGDPNAVAIRVENESEGIVVCVRYPPNTGRPCREPTTESNVDRNDTTVDFEITLPHGVRLDAATVNGPVDAVTDGEIDAKAVNGNVHAEGRDVREAKSVNGAVVVRVLERGGTSLDVKTVNGPIEVTLPPGSGVRFDARTLTGDINADGVSVIRPRYGPGASAHATLGDGARTVNAKTVNGSITLRR